MKSSTKFSLFFLALFTVSTRYYVECSNCGGTTALSQQQADNSIAYANARGAA